MAEAIATNHVTKEGREFFATSAGLATMDGLPISNETIATLKSMSIEHDGRSRRLTADMIANAALVLCMTQSHAEGVRHLAELNDQAADHIHVLCPDGKDLPDPIGQPQAVYDRLGERLATLIPGRVDGLLAADTAS